MGLPEKRPNGLDSPLVALAIKYGSRAQTWVYRRTGGRVGSRWRIGAGFRKPVDTLLLEHRGRKSGTTFTTPLLYLEDGDDLVVVASYGGKAANPEWYHNLVASPDVRVRVRTEMRDVRAREAGEVERERLWPRLVELYADFGKYQVWTDRHIPVMVLEPR